MAVKFTNDPSVITSGADKYEVKDKATGKAITTTPSISEDVKNAISSGKGVAYSADKGLYVASSTPAKLSYDTTTGRISISAPKSILESDWFKNAYTDNNTFKQVARLFKQNPADKTGYSFYDKDGKVTEKTVEAYLKEQADAFDKYYKQYMDYVVPRKAELSALTGSQKFSDSQAITSYSDTTREKNKFSTDVAIELPQIALTISPELKKLGSWNEETRSVNAKDFYEWYHLGGEKDEQLDRLNDTVASQLVMKASQKDMTEYDKDEFARLIAFNNTLKNDRPDAEWYQSLWYGTKATVNAFAGNLTKAGYSLVQFLETASTGIGEATNINTASGKILGVLTGGASVAIGGVATAEAATIRGLSIAGDNIGDIIAGADKNSDEAASVNGLIAFGDMLEGMKTGRIKETLDVWSKQTDTPLPSEAKEQLEKLYQEKLDSLEKLSGAVSVGQFIGNFAAEVVKQIFITNKIGSAVGGTISDSVSAAYALPGYATEISNYVAAANALEGGLGAYLAGMNAVNLASTFTASTGAALAAELGVSGFGANILAQGIVDTVLNDESSLEKLLTEGNTEEAFSAVLKNSTYNLFGEMTGLGTQKAVSAIKKSSVGQGLQVASWRLANKVAGKKHTILAEFADWMAEGNSRTARLLGKRLGANDSASRWYANLHWREAEAAFNIVNAAKGLSGEEAYTATAKAVLDKMQLEIDMGNVTRGVMRRFNEIVNNEAITKEYDEFNNAYSRLLKEEGTAAVNLGEGVYLPKDASSYIARLSKVDYLVRKGGPELVNLSKTETDYLSLLRTRIAAFETSHSEATVNAAKEVLEKFRVYEKAYMDYAVKPYDEGGLGLYNEDTVAGWRNTGYWGNNGEEYVPLVRIDADGNSLNAAKKALATWENGEGYTAKLSVDEYSYKPGDADAEYLDPALVMYTQQVTAAKVSLARDWGNTLMKNDVLAKEINTDGEYVTKTEIKRAKSAVRKTVEDVMKAYRTDETILGYDFAENYVRGTKLTKTKSQQKVLRTLGLSSESGYTRAAFLMDSTDMDNLRALGVNIPIIEEVTSDAEVEALYKLMSRTEKKIVTQALGTNKLNARTFNSALRETTMQEKLQQNWLSNYITIAKVAKDEPLDALEGYIMFRKTQMLNGKAAMRLHDAFSRYSDAIKQSGLRAAGQDDFAKEVSGLLEDMISQSEADLTKSAFFKKAIKKYADEGISEDVAKRYLVASEYKNYFTNSKSKKVLDDLLDKNLGNISTSGNLTTGEKLAYKKAIKEALEEMAESEWADSVAALKAAGGSSLIDTEEVYNYVYKQLEDFVDTTVKSRNVIQVLDANGKFHLYEVSPATADLYKTRPNLSGYKQRGLTRFFNETNRLARLGNVGFSLKSFTNQWARDPLNAYVMGGMVRTFGRNAAEVGDLLGPSVVEAVQDSMGEAGWKSFTEELTSQLGREATQEELETAARDVVKSSNMLKRMATEALGGTETETAFYRERATGARDAIWGQFEEQQSAMSRALEKLERHSIGEMRETYLRKAVFAQSYNDAITIGHTPQEARIIAEYTMQNATTNFSRAFAWGNNITNSVSFLGAAINGRASFWRLVEIDPVGVSMRFLTGLAIPTMALVSQSLQNETDRELYKSIPEYEKQDNLVFVVDGQKMKIPIPQELSAFIAPFRQVVEKAQDSNPHTWAELIANDLLATSAIDLTGFVDLDRNLLEGDATLMDRLSSEGRALVSQLSPTIVKTVYMGVTGIDPYTGNPIDRSKVWVDQNGQLQIQDSKTSAFTTWLSERLKSLGIELSGSSAHALIQSMLGNGFTNVIDGVSGLFSGEPLKLLEEAATDVGSAFIPSSSNDPAQYAWNEEIKVLKREKDALLSHEGELSKVSRALNGLDATASDYQTKRAELLKQYYSLTQDYQQDVLTAVKNLQDKYGAEYDRAKFAATIDLLTFYTPLGDSLTEYEKNLNRESYYAARNRAMRTMSQLGFDSPNDLSIFGYLRTNQYGEAEAKTYNPVAIMNQGNQVWGAKDVDVANIEAALEQNNLTRSEMFGDAYKKAKASGKAALKAYKADWNTKVVKAIAPYIQSRGVNAVLNSFDTRDLLDNYVFVDNPYQTKQYLTKIFGGS